MQKTFKDEELSIILPRDIRTYRLQRLHRLQNIAYRNVSEA